VVDLIVISSLGFLAVFFAAWILMPNLRVWIEKPKYRFQENVQNYDVEQKAQGRGLLAAEGTKRNG
jgi:hypothetical protein